MHYLTKWLCSWSEPWAECYDSKAPDYNDPLLLYKNSNTAILHPLDARSLHPLPPLAGRATQHPQGSPQILLGLLQLCSFQLTGILSLQAQEQRAQSCLGNAPS